LPKGADWVVGGEWCLTEGFIARLRMRSNKNKKFTGYAQLIGWRRSALSAEGDGTQVVVMKNGYRLARALRFLMSLK
jgi:hypothetical protein